MRVLMTTVPALGHFHPMVPLGRALAEKGHDVAFVSSPSFCETIRAEGFEALPGGLDWEESRVEEAFPDFRDIPTFGFENLAWWINRVFAGAAGEAMVPDLLSASRSWKADVIVHDATDFAAPIVGELTGIPHAVFYWPLRIPSDDPGALYREPWNALRRSHDLPEDPQGEAIRRYLVLDLVPPGYQHPATEPAPTGHPIAPLLFDNHGDEELPAWIPKECARPLVYATLGTVFNRTPGLLQQIIDTLAQEEISLVATVGHEQDPASFGSQPENVYIEHYVPQTLLFPECAAVVTHGGYNTVMTALANGLPMVITPISADQLFHAVRCAELGVALVVDPANFDADALRSAVRRVLEEPSFRAAAAGMRDEIEALPKIEHGVSLIERLAREKAPLLA